MSLCDFFAFTARGRSTQSFLLCVIAPQFSHAPFRNFVAWNVFTPRLYHDPDAPSPSFLSTSFHAFWCFRPFFCSRYHGAAAMNCGMCGLISLPSSSRSAGARPACSAGCGVVWKGRLGVSVKVGGFAGASASPRRRAPRGERRKRREGRTGGTRARGGRAGATWTHLTSLLELLGPPALLA